MHDCPVTVEGKLIKYDTAAIYNNKIIVRCILKKIYILQKMKDIQIGPLDAKDKTTGQRMVSSIIWLISTARNIIVVVFCAALGYMYKEHGDLPFKLSSNSTAHIFIQFVQ